MEGEPIILAIVGARTFSDQTLLNEKLQEFIVQYGMPTKVVSGGARGADQMGERWAKKHGIETLILCPQWRVDGKYNPRAGLDRNTDIVNACTHMVAFPSEKGRGTQDSIRKAKRLGKPVLVY